jgi:CTP:molybdopterin cytidylyltransferase MocA
VTIPFLLKLSQTDGVFLLPVDVPCPSTCVWKQLFPSELLDSPAASIPQYKNQGGHPVFLNRAFLKKLGALPFDSRLDQQIGALENKTRILTDDSRVGLNLNTPEDWKKFSGLTQL